MLVSKALLVCIRCASGEEIDFDVSDALAVILMLLDESLAGVDRLEVRHDQG
jgi:hypothetical protein